LGEWAPPGEKEAGGSKNPGVKLGGKTNEEKKKGEKGEVLTNLCERRT